jgi:hypothetical protein
VIDFVPAPENVVLRLACSPLSEAVPRTNVPFFVNVTVPLGVPPNCNVTAAVNVTDCPNFMRGLSEFD